MHEYLVAAIIFICHASCRNFMSLVLLESLVVFDPLSFSVWCLVFLWPFTKSISVWCLVFSNLFWIFKINRCIPAFSLLHIARSPQPNLNIKTWMFKQNNAEQVPSIPVETRLLGLLHNCCFQTSRRSGPQKRTHTHTHTPWFTIFLCERFAFLMIHS